MKNQDLKDRKIHLLAVLKERQIENGIVQEEFQKGYYAGFDDGCDAIIVKLEEPKDTTKLLSEIVRKMFDTLHHISENEDIKESDKGWISDDLDYVAINFFGEQPWSFETDEIKANEPMTTIEAINRLSVRINNTMQTLL